jgi:outer membrane murein-binding lipoprotein Lpp
MKSNNFHSVLSAICLAVMTWVGYETVESGKSIAGLKSEVATLNATLTKLERKLDDTVTHREIDPRVSQLETNMKQLASRLRDLELNSKLTKHP